MTQNKFGIEEFLCEDLVDAARAANDLLVCHNITSTMSTIRPTSTPCECCGANIETNEVELKYSIICFDMTGLPNWAKMALADVYEKLVGLK